MFHSDGTFVPRVTRWFICSYKLSNSSWCKIYSE